MTTAETFGGVSAGLDLLSGLFGFMGGDAAGDIASSRARMLRLEAEEDARRYGEQAQAFRDQQAMSYVKSGVALTGSPLEVLDETARVAAENVSAIRARARADALDLELQGEQARGAGRAALTQGLSSGARRLARVYGGKLGTEDAGTMTVQYGDETA